MLPKAILIFSVYVICSDPAVGQAASRLTAAEDVANQYSLTTSTSIPFPTSTLSSSDAQSFIETLSNGWSLSKGQIQNNPNNTAFVTDPFPNSPTPGLAQINTTGPVLQVTYPKGSLHDYGGTQLYSLWNTTDGSSFNSMLLSYELAFDAGFDWVKGGKLPGLRGGPDPNGCSGGNEPNGTDCFSSRLMWRTKGAGEVYAYMPTPNGLCKDNGIICNSDFGVSVERGSFSFVGGQWNRITMLVQMNNPPDVANGNLRVYFNDVQAISQTNLQFRSGNDVTVGGLYLSTFFGGNDDTWAAASTTHSYFRNFRLWGNSAPSNLTGAHVSAAVHTYGHALGWSWLVGIMVLRLAWAF